MEEEQEVMICNSNGLYICDDRVRTRLSMQAVAEENNTILSNEKTVSSFKLEV